MPTQESNVARHDRERKVGQEWTDRPPSTAEVEQRLRGQLDRILDLVKGDFDSLYDFEQALIPLVFALGRLALVLFLTRQEERLDIPVRERRARSLYERREAKSRLLGTFFGKIRYWRCFMHRVGGGGYFPLDIALRLPEGGFDMTIVGLMTRLATKLSFAQTRLLLCHMLGWSPSTSTIEKAVLGLGRYTQEWFEHAPAPEQDGEVLIIQIDSKCPPTATESELAKRRGRRKAPKVEGSPRHRGRVKRKQRGHPKRRKKGDKSKNGKMATLVVMYTLRRGLDRDGNKVLCGPLNKRVYASFANKRHAFAFARREADKRGFSTTSNKTIQILTDGDNAFACYVEEYFPEAVHTIDIFHVLEYVWQAARALQRKGGVRPEAWVEEQRQRLYKGEVESVIKELRRQLAAIPATGPGNKGRRERVEEALRYLEARAHLMIYDVILAEDFELGSGIVEGAVRRVIGQRFDAAGMRWIKERAEPLLQLRCIELNGQWEAFLAFVHARHKTAEKIPRRPHRLQLLARTPAPLPTLGAAA